MTIFNAYDAIEKKHSKTYVDPKYKKLYTNEISIRKFYSFGKRYNPNTKENEFYLILSNDTTDDRNWHSITTRKGLYNFQLFPIWRDSNLNYLNEITDITLRKVDEDADTIVYYLDI